MGLHSENPHFTEEDLERNERSVMNRNKNRYSTWYLDVGHTGLQVRVHIEGHFKSNNFLIQQIDVYQNNQL